MGTVKEQSIIARNTYMIALGCSHHGQRKVGREERGEREEGERERGQQSFD